MLESETQLKARLNYELQLRMGQEKKSRIEGWKSEYLQKYKRMTASTDNLFKLTNPTGVHKPQYNTSGLRASSVDENMLISSSFAEMNRIRVENIKREHMKHQSTTYRL